MGETRDLKPRVQRLDDYSTLIEPGFRFANGYEITVEWDESANAWAAVILGSKAVAAYAYGESKEIALLQLCCSLAATCDSYALDGSAGSAPGSQT